MGCIISPLLFVLIMEMILHSVEINANEITGQSMKAFMDDVTLVAESRSPMEQLLTGALQMDCDEIKAFKMSQFIKN